MGLDGLCLSDELISAIDFIEQIELSQGVVFNVSQKPDWVANFSQLRAEEETHSNPSLHALDVPLERRFKIGFDNLDNDLASVFQFRSVNLSNAGCSEGFHFDVFEMVHETVWSKAVQQLL